MQSTFVFNVKDINRLKQCSRVVYVGYFTIFVSLLMCTLYNSEYGLYVNRRSPLTFAGIVLDTRRKYLLTLAFVSITQVSRRIVQECGYPPILRIVSNCMIQRVFGICKSDVIWYLKNFRMYMNIMFMIHILAIMCSAEFAFVSFLSAELVTTIIDKHRLVNAVFNKNSKEIIQETEDNSC